jgi:hypothetical protein
MAKSAWPTGTELSAAVVGMGSAIPAGFDEDDIIAGAVEEFERLTGWEPFLADAGSDTRQYDPTYGFTLRTDHFFTVTSVTVAGVTKTEGTDFWVLPYNNALREKPITGLRFLTPLQGLPREVSVTGRLGYDDEIHLDAWNAVLKRAVAQCLELAAGPSGSVSEIEQGLVKVKYSGEAGRSTIDRFNNEFKQVVRRYKRADVF